MVGTGAAPNVIKKRNLNSETEIDTRDTLLLNGITNGSILTLGSVKINYMGHDIVLHDVGAIFRSHRNAS